jgi:glucose/arabinose dehydrogenase
MAFYTGDLFPQWRGQLFVGALVGRHLARLQVDGTQVQPVTQMLTDLRQRIRDVRSGPDGALWLLTDASNGQLMRIVPAADVTTPSSPNQD